MSSLRSINYKLRPAKAVERKMIVDIIRKLSVFHPLNSYQYIGFGSVYFVDFSLLHKLLGISEMISIEKDNMAKHRVLFNKPFSCIDVKFNSSNIELPKIRFNKPSIVWLDYDGKLNTEVLADINTVCANAQSGILFMISVNAQAEPKSDTSPLSIGDYRLEELEKQVGGAKIPIGTEGRDLNLKNLSKVLRRIIINEINSALSTRNGGLPDGQKLTFHQVVNFKYEDGATMITIGGLLVNESHSKLISSMNLEELKFYISDEESYTIEVPNLTNKEIAELDSQLHEIMDLEKFNLKPKVSFKNTVPDADIIRIKKSFKDIVPEADIIKYAKVYRYYPTFAEAIW